MIEIIGRIVSGLFETPEDHQAKPGADFPPKRSLFDEARRIRRSPDRYSEVDDPEEIAAIEPVRGDSKGRNRDR